MGRGSRLWPLPLAALLALCAGCDKQATVRDPASLTYTEDAHVAYREAMGSFESQDWEESRALFQEVSRVFAYSHYARLAELRVADVDFEQGKYDEAIAGYRSFVRAHRGDPNVEYAKYRIGKALYLDISDSALLPPQEERDQGNALDAYRELRTFSEEFPRSRYLVDASYMLEVATQRLVRHQLYVARYYLGRGNFEAAVARIDRGLKEYPGSGLDAEALVLKGETLLKMRQRARATEVFRAVVRDYGGPFGAVARSFLAELGEGS
ncbi:MAG: tetratricopeptide repeat protein [Deltaproteobacteria bacterium]|nr:tetratricopeptide repeat protein [Deltaproteobacteria bacterium]